MDWTPEQITQLISAIAALLVVLISIASLALGIFNYRNSSKQVGSGLNEDLSVIAEREAKSRRELQDEFDQYKAKTDTIISQMQVQIDELTRGEYEVRTVIVVGKKPVIKSNEIVSIKSRSPEITKQ